LSGEDEYIAQVNSEIGTAYKHFTKNDYCKKGLQLTNVRVMHANG
jgi:hypothetical protein